MSKKSVLAVITVAIAFLLLALAVQGRARLPWLDRVIVAIAAPVNEKLVAVSNNADSVRNFFAALTTMQDENNKLKTEVETLRYANIQMAEIWAENQRLSNLLQYKNDAKNLKLQTAKVIGKNIGDIKDTVLINLGSNAGLRENMAVVNASGLVGIIDETYPDAARVLLITSPRCKAGGIVLRANSRVVGVVNGLAGGDAVLQMSNMARDADIVEGDIVVTSGFGGNHPGGLVIGTVSEVSLNVGGLLKQAKIVPAVDFGRLEEVMVVTDYQNPSNLIKNDKDTNKQQSGGPVK